MTEGRVALVTGAARGIGATIAGRLADHARGRRLHLAASAPWAWLVLAGINRLRALPAPT
ncbi:MAG: hypothetical protein NVS3B21_35920 [Acidimicrobiales bacterium]